MGNIKGQSRSNDKDRDNGTNTNKSKDNNNNNNNNNSNNNPTVDPMDLIAARLGFIGTIISTIGDGVQAIAAGITLRQLEEQIFPEARAEVDQFRQTENIQQQVDFYINELIQIRKMIK